MADYRLTANPNMVIRTADSAYIPADPANSDWLVYEQWRVDGGVPDSHPVPLGSSQFDWGPPVANIIGEY